MKRPALEERSNVEEGWGGDYEREVDEPSSREGGREPDLSLALGRKGRGKGGTSPLETAQSQIEKEMRDRSQRKKGRGDHSSRYQYKRLCLRAGQGKKKRAERAGKVTVERKIYLRKRREVSVFKRRPAALDLHGREKEGIFDQKAMLCTQGGGGGERNFRGKEEGKRASSTVLLREESTQASWLLGKGKKGVRYR